MHLRTLAFRRHQELKRKTWVKTTFKNHWSNGLIPARIGKVAHSPAQCSCHMCGNPRKYLGDRTLSELRVIEAMQCEIDTINKSYYSDLNI